MSTKEITFFYRQYAVIAITLGMGGFLFFFWFPSMRKILIRENQILELSTAFFYCLTCVLVVPLWQKSKNGKRKHLALTLGILAFFGFLEEISWGIYLIRHLHPFEVPIIYGEKIDALHDIIVIVYRGLKIESGLMFFLLFIGIGVVFLLLLVVLLKFQLYNFRMLRDIFKQFPSTGFIGIWGGLMVLANGYDVLSTPSTTGYSAWDFGEEFLEMLGALSLLFAYRLFANEQQK